MLKLLFAGRAEGVIIQNIDRSARNLREWADLGELINKGVQVHFAYEGLDLHSRGSRLLADIHNEHLEIYSGGEGPPRYTTGSAVVTATGRRRVKSVNLRPSKMRISGATTTR
jgi:Resolvase, N terminal domain